MELIRNDYEFGLSKREIARKRGVHRAHSAPGAGLGGAATAKAPGQGKLTPQIKAFIDQILEADKSAPRKQRHTALQQTTKASEMNSMGFEQTPWQRRSP